LLTLPVVLLYRRRRQIASLQASVGISLMLVANMIDLIPNATVTPITWILAGAVLGRAELASRESVHIPAPSQADPPVRRLRPALGALGRVDVPRN
jgi:hypothetical protein